jgi:hypothetical protein
MFRQLECGHVCTYYYRYGGKSLTTTDHSLMLSTHNNYNKMIPTMIPPCIQPKRFAILAHTKMNPATLLLSGLNYSAYYEAYLMESSA